MADGNTNQGSNKNMYTPEQMQLIAAAAIASVPPKPDMTEDDWQRAVVRRASTIQRLRFLQEGSIMMNVLDSIRIKAVIKAVTFEQSSQRYVIEYVASNSPDGTPEQMRTPRIDTYAGRIILKDIERLKECVGTDRQVIIFKHNEVISEEKAANVRSNGGIVPNVGYRQAVWFEFN